MGKYSCDKCAKSFSKKSHYDKHISRKNPCEIQTDKIKALINKAVDEKLSELNINLKLNNNENNITKNTIEQKDILKMSKIELLEKCKEMGITKCSSKNKPKLIELINSKTKTTTNNTEEYKNILISETVINEPRTSTIIEPISETLNVLDLFCGCGGMSKGLTDAGLNIIAGIDIWDKAVESYNKNFEHKAYCEDLTKLPPENFNKLYNKENKNIDILVGGPPCFITGTLVLTYNGYKNIEDVKLDDRLLTHTGQFQSIINLQRKIYTGDVYELKIKYHPEITTCTEEHPFYIREKNKVWDNSIRRYKTSFTEPLWKSAKELTLNDYFGMVINQNEIIPAFTFDKIINQNKTEQIQIILNKPEQWYMMGYFIGEGWIEETKKRENSTRHNIKFSINNKDEEEVLGKINQVLKIIDLINNSGKCKKFGCSDYVWAQILKKFGKYTPVKLIPEWVEDAPRDFIQEFINGYMKADGNVCKNGSLQLTTVSPNLAYGLQRLYLKLGHIFSINKNILPKIKVIEDIIVNQRDTYTIRGLIQKEHDITTFIEDGYVWYAPFKITKREVIEEPVYNFEVDIDNSYIVANTIVHNCQSFSIAGKRDKNDPRNTLFMEYVKYLDYFKPKAFIMENVIGMLSKKTSSDEKVIDIIMEQLNRNYNCIINKLYASDFEVPQNRRRAIIIGIRKNLNILPKEPEPIITSVKDRIPVKNILVPKKDIDKKYYLSEKALAGIANKKVVNKKKGRGFGAQMLDLEKPSYTIPARYWKDGYDALVRYSETEIRRLTIIELKRIQSFPDNYIIDGSNKDIIMQIGNAVACRFAYHLGNYIINTLQ
jgi:DNA-cytosine methyltransferase